MSFWLLRLLFSCLFVELLNGKIDRTIYSNFQATEQHDNYLSFQSLNATLQFPLSLKSKIPSLSCYWDIPLFIHNTIYCFSRSFTSFNRQFNTSIISINSSDGSINWETIFYPDHIDINNIVNNMEGLVYIDNYLGIVNDAYGKIFIINATTGQIIYKINIDSISSCIHTNIHYTLPCLLSGITSSYIDNNPMIFVYFITDIDGFNTTETSNGTIVAINANTGNYNTITINNQHWHLAMPPTICNDNNILIVGNSYSSINAFNISNNYSLLWTFNISGEDDRVPVIYPQICITNNNYVQLLVQNIFTSGGAFAEWFLLDGITGLKITTLNWFDSGVAPVINNDKNILIRVADSFMCAYDLTSSNVGTWKIIWKKDHGSDNYGPMLIIDDYLLFINEKGMNFISINNGTNVWSYDIQDSIGDPMASINNEQHIQIGIFGASNNGTMYVFE